MRTPSPRRRPRQRLGFLAFAFVSQLAPLHGEPENPPHHTADLHEKARDQFAITPSNKPYLFEIAARFLIQTYHHADPEGAVAFLRQMPLNLEHITAPAWGVVLARTPDAAVRAALFGEIPQRLHISPAALAGLAEVDPQAAWQRLQEIPLAADDGITQDSREYVAWNWIKHWAYHQPEQSLRFLATLEMDDEMQSLHEECFYVMIHHHAAYITRSMESLHGKLDKFNFDSFSASLCEDRPHWMILDGPPPLSTLERYKILTVTLRTADLSPDFKARLLKVKRPDSMRRNGP